MPTPLWQPGTLYPTGSLVQPVSAAPPVNTAIDNPGFESGDNDWTKGADWAIVNDAGDAFQGSWLAVYDGNGTANLDSDSIVAVVPGKSITALCMVDQGAASAGDAGARVALRWLTSADVEISISLGTNITSGSDGTYVQSSVTGVAPATAAKVHVRVIAFSDGSDVRVDNVSWNYATAAVPAGLVYRAVQTATGASGNEEPTWPLTLGLTVVDNEVTWEAVQANRVVWEATPLFVSGLTEPDWPTAPGGAVVDGTLQLVAVDRRITDPKCPHKIPTRILASHVFNGDDDIVAFCMAANPLNWSEEANAGFLPTGLQQSNTNGVAVLAMYRANLAVLNASSFQLWQADPDPELMDILDQKDGIGSVYYRAAVNVGDDLFYLSPEGIRSIVGAAGNNSLQYDAVGAPIDDLVQAALAAAIASAIEPFGGYYPGLGQVLIAFPSSDNPGAYFPLEESGVAFTFTPVDALAVGLTASVIATLGGGTSYDWTLELPPNTLVRVTCGNLSAEGGIDTATFETENDTIVNESEDAGFLPSPFEIVVGADGLLNFTIDAGGLTYDFVIEVFVPGDATEGTTEVFVGTKVKGAGWTWSRWLFPFLVTDFSLFGTELYFRHGDSINHFDKTVQYDERPDGDDVEQVEFGGVVQWNWLDLGSPGTTKHLQAFDLIATGVPSVSFGYDQRNKATFTPAYEIDPDTLPGGPIQYEVTAPAISVRVEFEAGSPWSLSSMLLYVDDLGPGL